MKKKRSLLRNERSSLLVPERFIVLVIIRVHALEFKLFGISNSTINPGVPVEMAVGVTIEFGCFCIGFAFFSPCVHGVEVDKHVDD